VTSSSSDKRMAFQDFRILLIALERTHHLVGQRESKNADSVSALATDMSSAVCFNFCFLFADSSISSHSPDKGQIVTYNGYIARSFLKRQIQGVVHTMNVH